MDKYYLKLWDVCHDSKILEAAGFIEEPTIKEVDIDIPNIKEDEVILLLTGCFAPIHEGHIEALEIAKKELEKREIKVGLGLLGLCHDNYVLTKTDKYSLKDRIEKIEDITKEHSWIKPYAWEAKQNGAMNFTSVIDSITRKTNSKVVFVYGLDNYNFRLAFLNNDINICIERDINEKFPRYLPEITTNTIYIDTNKYKNISSSSIRKNHLHKP